MQNYHFILYFLKLTSCNNYIKMHSVYMICYIYIYLATRNSPYLFVKMLAVNKLTC